MYVAFIYAKFSSCLLDEGESVTPGGVISMMMHADEQFYDVVIILLPGDACFIRIVIQLLFMGISVSPGMRVPNILPENITIGKTPNIKSLFSVAKTPT